MSREDYVGLVQDFCEEIGLAHASELLDQGVLQMEDMLVGIEYLEEREEIRILMDLGEIEDERGRAILLPLLLQSNLSNTSAYLPTFSLHPETGHPIVAYHLPLMTLLEEDISLAFVLNEQLLPVFDEWKSVVQQALAGINVGRESSSLPESFA
ncbi:hypothetical protein H4CHR_00255 [Variovorax sp. PBS-H4]|uniref:CesT family type III secretion system chaperone n=1 Tax=Variovorax sp. PBS-H4 TaxID=434008 RepID=UPI0013161134|nr:CesT family type III secretion system chaperone [Variovorax sp. PBS-H4]VTU18787.1 hypothetical protein H4CHR_00255 [Variovorax sp. PBS-H4]